MKLKQVIGGLEEMYDPTKTNQPDYPDDYKKGKVIGHNQLCNREVSVDEKKLDEIIRIGLKFLLLNESPYTYEQVSTEIAKALSKAIEKGKVLRVKK